MATFERGEFVTTPSGYGRVGYQRMAAPDYTEAEAVCVILDAKRSDPGYSGTVFPAGEVRKG